LQSRVVKQPLGFIHSVREGLKPWFEF